MEDHYSRLEQEEHRISKVEGKMVIRGKTEELVVKQLMTYERIMQELTYYIKRPNLRIISIEEGEEVQANGICNIFNKRITENFPSLEKTMSIQVQKASRTPK
jgi:hypothetical protein